MKVLILKKLLHLLIFASAVFLFVLHVHGVVDLFSNGRTNFSVKKVNYERLELPAVTLCSAQSFDWAMLKSYNLSNRFQIINENNNIGNKTVYDIFEEVSMIINKDFSLHIFLTGVIGPPLVEGRNIFQDIIQGEFYIDVYKMYSMYDGICYTIASNYSPMSDDYVEIVLKFNESISESKMPSSINGVLSTPEERYGIVFGTWTGTAPLTFKLNLRQRTQLMIEKHVMNRLVNSASEPCTHYKNTAVPTCIGKYYITVLLNYSSEVCENPCKLASLQNFFELLPNNTIPKCLTVKDHNCMMKYHSNRMVNPTCKPACSLTRYVGSVQGYEEGDSDKITILGIVYTSTSVTISEEFRIYDIYSFVGSVGGYMGLFIGFSFFDFGVMIVNYFIDKYINGVAENI
jgi:hypothetical protein